MKHNLYSTLLFALIAVLCLGLIGCAGSQVGDIPHDTVEGQNASPENIESSSHDTVQSNITPGDDVGSMDYEIVEQSGKNYIVFNDASLYQNNGQIQLASLEFNSLTEFKTSVTTGKLSDWQKAVIATAFKKNEIGILTCDFDKLWEPRMPSNCTIDGVAWGGETYTFFVSTPSKVFGFIHNYSQSKYYDVFQNDFENRFNNPAITVNEVISTAEGKTVTTYSTWAGELMSVRYTASSNNETFVVDETYRLNMADDSLETSDSIPSNVTLYCVSGDAYYVVDLFGFTEPPSESWLFGFHMEPYNGG